MISEELILRLSHADPAVRIRAIEELARLDDPDALACLVARLNDSEEQVSAAARAALCRVTGLDLGGERDAWLDWWKQKAGLTCAHCGKRLYSSRLYYLARIQLTSEPRELYLSQEDLRPRTAGDLRRAAEELSKHDPAGLEEEVYVHLRYYLCTPCKLEFVRDARESGALDDD
ncbi:MAG: HEAT repeat domain-containing protein [Candidatus Wallbacteria bacterium]|nr:HEAT repeat domain-containing protein [Candidatus Wallbacteria bacterium]